MLLENRFTQCFWKLIHSHTVTPCWLDDCKECIQSGWSKQAWLLLLGTRNPSQGCWSLRKLHFSTIIWRLALGFSMDLWLNATKRRINLSVYLVFDLEARRFKFLGQNLLSGRKWPFQPWLLEIFTTKLRSFTYVISFDLSTTISKSVPNHAAK